MTGCPSDGVFGGLVGFLGLGGLVGFVGFINSDFTDSVGSAFGRPGFIDFGENRSQHGVCHLTWARDDCGPGRRVRQVAPRKGVEVVWGGQMWHAIRISGLAAYSHVTACPAFVAHLYAYVCE